MDRTPQQKPKVLVVDDEPAIRLGLTHRCTDHGYAAVEAGSGVEALELFAGGVDLTLLDYRLPDIDGLALLKRFRALSPGAPVILMTAYPSIEQSVEMIKAGAYHYMAKPFELDDMMRAVEGALQSTELKRNLKSLRESQAKELGFDAIAGASGAIETVRKLLKRIAESSTSAVLMMGERGTGKELAAKAIHAGSARSSKPFMSISCSELPEPVLERELFGVAPGAFGSAQAETRGLFEHANGGTIYLDEISEASPALQAKLIRLLDEKSLKRAGGTTDIQIDVRVIAATKRNLEDVRRKSFREDLYYRLRTMSVTMPPLRERREDVLPLTNWFIERFNVELEKKIAHVSSNALDMLEAYPWPGNARELRNAVEGAMSLARTDTLEAEDFQPFTSQSPDLECFRLPRGGLIFEDLERDLVRQALERSGGNQTRAGSLLGMNRDQIRYRMEKFGLPRPRSATDEDDPEAR